MSNNSPNSGSSCSRLDVSQDDRYLAFEDAIGSEANVAEEQIDDDLVIEHDAQQLAPNNRCPITFKPVILLVVFLAFTGVELAEGELSDNHYNYNLVKLHFTPAVAGAKGSSRRSQGLHLRKSSCT